MFILVRSEQLGFVLAPGLLAPSIVRERRSRDGELAGDGIQQPRGRLLAATQALARMAQEAELHGRRGLIVTAKSVRKPPFAEDPAPASSGMLMQMVGSFADFERAMIRERTAAGLAAAPAEGRVGGRRKKLDAAKRREIAESLITGRKSGAEMARLYGVSQPTVSRIVAAHRAPTA